MNQVQGLTSYAMNISTTTWETAMNQQNKDQPKQPAPPHSPPLEDVNKQKLKAEEHEVSGRHKNDGQKYHKGAR